MAGSETVCILTVAASNASLVGRGRQMVQTGFHYRDAIRLLFILVHCSKPLPEPDPVTGAIRIFHAEKRALAIDFWIRYPDYLADELLDLFEDTHDPELLKAVQHIFQQEE